MTPASNSTPEFTIMHKSNKLKSELRNKKCIAILVQPCNMRIGRRCNCIASSTLTAYSHVAAKLSFLQQLSEIISLTRHRASTSMYSLTFCVRFLLPERHQWKPAVQTAVVMLRTPPSAAGRPRPLPVCAVRFWGRIPPVAGRRRAQTSPSRPFAICCHIAGWTQACN